MHHLKAVKMVNKRETAVRQKKPCLSPTMELNFVHSKATVLYLFCLQMTSQCIHLLMRLLPATLSGRPVRNFCKKAILKASDIRVLQNSCNRKNPLWTPHGCAVNGLQTLWMLGLAVNQGNLPLLMEAWTPPSPKQKILVTNLLRSRTRTMLKTKQNCKK